MLFTGDFGEVQGRILLTALLVAGFSIVALCDLALAGRALRVAGLVGVGVAILALLLGLVVIWRDWSGGGFGEILRAFAIAGIWSLSLAQGNLLLLLAHRRRFPVRMGLGATCLFILLTATLVSLPILTNGEIPGEAAPDYWRAFGVVVILDALGTIVVPVLALFLRDDDGDAVPAVPGSIPVAATPSLESGWVQLSPELAADVARVATAARTTPEVVVAFAVRRHLDERRRPLSPPDPDGAATAR
ncbi:hypothetical protein [Plantibacter sp. RU18]|uniref:hypothetical protein n=1 Tax=Plantibacter sp. RU18 TaxID=3158143 RepID=UPI003D3646C8